VGPGTTLPLFTRVFADIGDRQSIAASLSTFSAHARALAEVLEHAGPGTLVLLDEIGGGTDPAEGGALAAAVLRTLTRRHAVTLATTHLGALKRLASETTGIVNASLQFDAETLTPTYRFVKGVPGRSYGLAIARRLGLPAPVLAEAEREVPADDRALDALLAEVEARGRELAQREAELAAERDALARERGVVDERGDAVGERERAVRARERALDAAAREQARAYLLEARKQVEAALGRARAAVDEATAREARRLVESAIAETKIGGDEGRGTGDAGARTVSVGDRARVGAGAVGVVREVRDDGTVVLETGSVRLVVPVGELHVIDDSGAGERGGHRAHRRVGGPATAAEPGVAAGRSGASDPEVRSEVDLRGMRADEVDDVLLRALDAAVLADLPYLRIIHGKGTGALRDRVRALLAADPRVAHAALAPANQGGTGVTIAELR
jgi:DNA mismatch repair protein MutS2